jgi:hypothetical protein
MDERTEKKIRKIRAHVIFFGDADSFPIQVRVRPYVERSGNQPICT